MIAWSVGADRVFSVPIEGRRVIILADGEDRQINYGLPDPSGGISYQRMRDGQQNGSTLGWIRTPSYALSYASAVDFGVPTRERGHERSCRPPTSPRSHAPAWAREKLPASHTPRSRVGTREHQSLRVEGYMFLVNVCW